MSNVSSNINDECNFDRLIVCGKSTAHSSNFGNRVYRAFIHLLKTKCRKIERDDRKYLVHKLRSLLVECGYSFKKRIRNCTENGRDELVEMNVNEITRKIGNSFRENRNWRYGSRVDVDDESMIEAQRLIKIVQESCDRLNMIILGTSNRCVPSQLSDSCGENENKDHVSKMTLNYGVQINQTNNQNPLHRTVTADTIHNDDDVMTVIPFEADSSLNLQSPRSPHLQNLEDDPNLSCFMMEVMKLGNSPQETRIYNNTRTDQERIIFEEAADSITHDINQIKKVTTTPTFVIDAIPQAFNDELVMPDLHNNNMSREGPLLCQRSSGQSRQIHTGDNNGHLLYHSNMNDQNPSSLFEPYAIGETEPQLQPPEVDSLLQVLTTKTPISMTTSDYFDDQKNLGAHF